MQQKRDVASEIYRVGQKVCPTGLFTASGHFDTPLISVVDGPILKPFGVVIVITGWFGLVYNNA